MCVRCVMVAYMTHHDADSLKQNLQWYRHLLRRAACCANKHHLSSLKMHEKADLLYGIPALATHLGIAERQVRNLIKIGELPTFKIGRKVCSRRSTCDELLAQREAEANRVREAVAA